MFIYINKAEFSVSNTINKNAIHYLYRVNVSSFKSVKKIKLNSETLCHLQWR